MPAETTARLTQTQIDLLMASAAQAGGAWIEVVWAGFSLADARAMKAMEYGELGRDGLSGKYLFRINVIGRDALLEAANGQ